MEGFRLENNIHEQRSDTEKYQAAKRAIFGAFIALMPQNVEAMELPNGTSWQTGIERFEDAAKNEHHEYSSLYVQSGRYGNWLATSKGHAKSVRTDLEGSIKDTVDTVNYSMELGLENKTVKACWTHSHPKSNLDDPNVFMGPNLNDMRYVAELSHVWHEDLKHNDFQLKSSGMLYEGHGSWYFALDDTKDFDDSEIVPFIQVPIEKLHFDYTDAVKSGNAEAEAETLKTLLSAYDLKGVKVRFVPYDQLKTEPPCAGPDYVPSQEDDK